MVDVKEPEGDDEADAEGGDAVDTEGGDAAVIEVTDFDSMDGLTGWALGL